MLPERAVEGPHSPLAVPAPKIHIATASVVTLTPGRGATPPLEVDLSTGERRAAWQRTFRDAYLCGDVPRHRPGDLGPVGDGGTGGATVVVKSLPTQDPEVAALLSVESRAV